MKSPLSKIMENKKLSLSQEAILNQIELCAERGWKATYTLSSGEIIPQAFITAVDENKKAIVLEVIGGRSSPPNLVFCKDIKSMEAHW